MFIKHLPTQYLIERKRTFIMFIILITYLINNKISATLNNVSNICIFKKKTQTMNNEKCFSWS